MENSRFWKFLKIKDGFGTMLKKYEKISKEHKKDRQFWLVSKRRRKSELNKTKLAEKVAANEKLNDEDSGIITCSNQMGLTEWGNI